MNGAECGWCGGSHDESTCSIVKEQERKRKVQEGKEVAEIGIDVFSKAPKGFKEKLIKWLWPDLKRLAVALYNYWAESTN